MRRIFQNLIAALLGGLVWAGYTYLQLHKTYTLPWQVLASVAGIGFCLVMLSTSIVGVFIKDDRMLKVEVVKGNTEKFVEGLKDGK
jgi:hypothetical protein